MPGNETAQQVKRGLPLWEALIYLFTVMTGCHDRGRFRVLFGTVLTDLAGSGSMRQNDTGPVPWLDEKGVEMTI
ncbi:MAG TPA: hypothetical protein GXX36_06505 [Clostridiaceae bacterium]|nr:hypothetical protein [Clostridiaceae bacterium]